MIEKIPIMEMTDDQTDVSKSIVRLPYCDIADIVSWIGEREPLAVIPPYNKNVVFTARAASLLRDRIGCPIVVAVVSDRASAARNDLQSFREGGFASFALRGELGDSVLEHLFPIAPEGLWFHLAGRAPKRELVGKWTWSEEPL